jgi:hypothetical protein
MYNPADVRWPVLISTMSQYYQRYYRIFGLNALVGQREVEGRFWA